MLFTGLMIRLLGVILMIDARSPSGTTFQLIACQVLQGVGGGFASIAVQVSAQAAVAHIDVATVTAMVLLLTEVGNSVGSALAAGVWATYMPRELSKHVGGLPGVNQTLLDELFGSIMDITLYDEADPIRVGAVLAYQDVMCVAQSCGAYTGPRADDRYKLVFGAILLALFPPIICLVFTRDIRLTRAQNAVENTDLAGRDTGEVADPAADRGSVRLHAASSPAKRMAMGLSGEHGDVAWKTVGRKKSGASGWRVRALEDGEEDPDEGRFLTAPRRI